MKKFLDLISEEMQSAFEAAGYQADLGNRQKIHGEHQVKVPVLFRKKNNSCPNSQAYGGSDCTEELDLPEKPGSGLWVIPVPGNLPLPVGGSPQSRDDGKVLGHRVGVALHACTVRADYPGDVGGGNKGCQECKDLIY